MDKYHIPKYLDAPFKVVLWTWDELVGFFVPFLTCFWLLNSPVSGVVLGCCFVAGLKKIKGEEGHYFIAHLAYWHLPPLVKYKATPSSCFREILG